MKNVSSITNAPKGGIGEVINEKDAVAVCEVAVLSTHNIKARVLGLGSQDEDLAVAG